MFDTTSFSTKTNFRGFGDGLYLVERFKHGDTNPINYEVTVTDPMTFTRP